MLNEWSSVRHLEEEHRCVYNIYKEARGGIDKSAACML